MLHWILPICQFSYIFQKYLYKYKIEVLLIWFFQTEVASHKAKEI